MKSILTALLISTSVLGQNTNSIPEAPNYDSQGRMIAYQYGDGTRGQYMYDGASRMIRFIDHAGGVTTFKYNGDGSMVTIMPDGTTRN